MGFILLILAIGAFWYFGRGMVSKSGGFGGAFSKLKDDFKRAKEEFDRTSWQDRQNSRFWGDKIEAQKQASRLFVALIAKVAKADGVVLKSEAAYISEILNDVARQVNESGFRSKLKEVFNEAKDDNVSVSEIAHEYAQFISSDFTAQTVIFLLNLAYIDGDFAASERAMVQEIGFGLGLNHYEIQQIFERFEAESKKRESTKTPAQKDPWTVLGVPKNASFDEIKKAYRKLAHENHPDFLANEPDHIISVATKRLQEINEAYNILKDKYAK